MNGGGADLAVGRLSFLFLSLLSDIKRGICHRIKSISDVSRGGEVLCASFRVPREIRNGMRVVAVVTSDLDDDSSRPAFADMRH